MPGPDVNRGAKRAREARARLGLGPAEPVACIVALAEAAGLPVVVAALPPDVAGALWRGSAGPPLIWVNGRQLVARQRFTVAHELGHVACGHAGGVDAAATLQGETHDPREVQANAFAAERLAPRAGVEELVGGPPSLEDVVRVAAHFGVSARAALVRMRALGLATAARAARLGRELDAGHGEQVRAWLALPERRDVLALAAGRPRLPPALEGSALAALVRGEASVQAAAQVAGCPPAALAAGAAAFA